MKKKRILDKHFPQTIHSYQNQNKFYSHVLDQKLVQIHSMQELQSYLYVTNIPAYSHLQYVSRISNQCYLVILSHHEMLYTRIINEENKQIVVCEKQFQMLSQISKISQSHNSAYLYIGSNRNQQMDILSIFSLDNRQFHFIEKNINLPHRILSREIIFSGIFDNPYRLQDDRQSILYQQNSNSIKYLTFSNEVYLTTFNIQKQSTCHNLKLPRLQYNIQNPQQRVNIFNRNKIMYKYIPLLHKNNTSLGMIFNRNVYGLLDYRINQTILLRQNQYGFQFITGQKQNFSNPFQIYAIKDEKIYIWDIRFLGPNTQIKYQILKHDSLIEKAFNIGKSFLIQDLQSSKTHIYS